MIQKIVLIYQNLKSNNAVLYNMNKKCKRNGDDSMKKIIKLFIVFFFALFFSAHFTYALEYVTNRTPEIDFSKESYLTINFKTHDGIPLYEAEFRLYKVADFVENGKMVISQEFADYPIDFNEVSEEEWLELPTLFNSFIDKNEIAPLKTGITDEEGNLNFGECEKGLYLVRSKPHVQDIYLYTPTDFFVTLPNLVDDDWVYDVKSEPKYLLEDYDNLINIEVIKVWEDKGYEENRPKEIVVSLLKGHEDTNEYKEYKEITLNDENNWTYTWENLDGAYDFKIKELYININYETTIKREGNTFIIVNKYKEPTYDPILPNTGQLWWPVPILIGSGLIFISLGFIINRSKKEKRL